MSIVEGIRYTDIRPPSVVYVDRSFADLYGGKNPSKAAGRYLLQLLIGNMNLISSYDLLISFVWAKRGFLEVPSIEIEREGGSFDIPTESITKFNDIFALKSGFPNDPEFDVLNFYDSNLMPSDCPDEVGPVLGGAEDILKLEIDHMRRFGDLERFMKKWPDNNAFHESIKRKIFSGIVRRG